MEENTQSKKKEWNWSEHKPNNALNITPTPEKNFFKWWCIILDPFIHLSPREVDVMAAYLRQRHELKKVISDPSVLDSQLMSNKVKFKIIEECNITVQNYYVVMGNLKKKNVITESGINPLLIPNIRQDDKGHFIFLVLFNGDGLNDV